MAAQLRAMGPHDLDAILALWRETSQAAFPHIRHPENGEWWQAELRDVAMRNSIWVADLEGESVGFRAMDEAHGYIDQLFIDMNAQRQGIGSALLGLAKKLSPSGLRRHTLVENAPARAFYEKHGFRAGGLETEAFGGRPNVEYTWSPGDTQA